MLYFGTFVDSNNICWYSNSIECNRKAYNFELTLLYERKTYEKN